MSKFSISPLNYNSIFFKQISLKKMDTKISLSLKFSWDIHIIKLFNIISYFYNNLLKIVQKKKIIENLN